MKSNEMNKLKKLTRAELSQIKGGKNSSPGGECSLHRCKDGCDNFGGPSHDCVCHNNTGWCGPYVR
ncbi:MAG TPA: hypothetical protein VM802_27845 [Chitinophaga sp.]|uniref:bacteriocin-like protein n=1 Tax=Chitinophaga sp. TaxID=1869181 RepID=UPI002BDC6048|nr:hypothetical protein [Chitinophaga sp.]HVI48713.1 hypothetical protein [Chitinophaga sp.]